MKPTQIKFIDGYDREKYQITYASIYEDQQELAIGLGFNEESGTQHSQIAMQPLQNKTKTGILQLGLSPDYITSLTCIKGDVTLVQLLPSMAKVAVATKSGHFCLLDFEKRKRLEPY